MSNITPNLGLFKYDIEQDANTPFSITTALNNNWDIIDKKCNGGDLNNPYSLFDYKYSPFELNNISWLRSNGQWNAKSVYPNAYDKLLKVYNGTETVKGLSVKLSTEAYTNYDFVINTSNNTFRLPLDTIDHPINSTGTLPVKGNGIALGLTNGTTNYGLGNTTNAYNRTSAATGNYGSNVGTAISGNAPSNVTLGITTDSTKSGIVADLTATKANLYLYFYIGETVQNANLIDAGRIAEQLASKQDTLQYKMVDSYVNGTSGYNIWKTPIGYYCEQRGYVNMTSTGMTVNLIKKYKDKNYTIVAGTSYASDLTNAYSAVVGIVKSQNSFNIKCSNTNYRAYWQTSGYLAEGEY